MPNTMGDDIDKQYKEYVENAPFYFAGKPDTPARLLAIRGVPGSRAYCGRTSATENFPVSVFKYSLLRKHYPKSAFFFIDDYDIDVTDPRVIPLQQKLMRKLLERGTQILLTIFIPSGDDCYDHALAGILTPSKTLFIINTSPTPYVYLDDIRKLVNIYIGGSVSIVDVIAGTGIDLQSAEDEIFCVTWMLNALYENGGSIASKESLQSYLQKMKRNQTAMGGNAFIINKLNEFKRAYTTAGKRNRRKRKTYRRRRICPCSPDVGDCPRCNKRKTFKRSTK